MTNPIRQFRAWLRAEDIFPPPEKPKPAPEPEPTPAPSGPDFSEVRGQRWTKRAIEVAIAGGHNVLMIGPPGSGKSMLAKRVPSILPPLTQQAYDEICAIYRLAGLQYKGVMPPFQAPHNTASYAALVGGGSSQPRPGTISLAHNGVLFLDELPEFNRAALEALRQPLEDGKVTIIRTNGQATYPANIVLVAAMNPCPCGYAPNCQCKPEAIRKYRNRISGPLMDRIDIHTRVSGGGIGMLQEDPGEPSEIIRRRVYWTRQRQYGRQKKLNATLEIDDFGIDDTELLKNTYAPVGRLSMRACVRILRVARTIADLSAKEQISGNHIKEAISYRIMDK
jgi:magnesium chelatase family protein